jgi:hypothetical protein
MAGVVVIVLLVVVLAAIWRVYLVSPCRGCIVTAEGCTGDGSGDDFRSECHAFLAYQKRLGRH